MQASKWFREQMVHGRNSNLALHGSGPVQPGSLAGLPANNALVLDLTSRISVPFAPSLQNAPAIY